MTTPSRNCLYAVLASTVVSLIGGVLSVSGGLSSSYLDALGPDGHLSVPLPMTAFQVLMALAAASRRRSLALVGAVLLTLAVTLAVASGFFDGGYADDRLDSVQSAYQVLLVLSLCVVAVVAALRAWRVSRNSAA
jgi:hypothetical protein